MKFNNITSFQGCISQVSSVVSRKTGIYSHCIAKKPEFRHSNWRNSYFSWILYKIIVYYNTRVKGPEAVASLRAGDKSVLNMEKARFAAK